MPTTKRRHQVTETPEVAHALKIAERRWPGRSQSALLASLATLGAETLKAQEADRAQVRREALRKVRGRFDEAFPEDYLADLRRDWAQ
ncbi:hypothetical protein EK0264_00825 [Epidermidibacterium keratini]|uniref:Uncharacterized protein n=1 Tax=Epidermidibacterium keratini TaxID=1891644 RepID=A0A7L4YJ84_9ACTN|nr:hypothetical protein [Epidermidibacterium keratini]QHB98982.1 hypothetical protein EK0264_00825 [Epidermidibacterium keratini]